MVLPQDIESSRMSRGRHSQSSFISPSPLLPAFEPVSSSPGLPLPLKRKHEASPSRGRAIRQQYPTPVPTSSTIPLPSSPPEPPKTRPILQRTMSTVSERQPLTAVPSVELPPNGEALLMGRSSNSSHYQLSANRLISRVHVSATYCPPNEMDDLPKIVVECLGWNGCKVHCRGNVYDLGKGDTFTADKPFSQVMLDVQDARVLLVWPEMHRNGSLANISDATWDEDVSPLRAYTPAIDALPSSPPEARAHLESPVSPSPLARTGLTASSTFLGLHSSSPSLPAVQVYEDASGDEEKLCAQDSILRATEAAETCWDAKKSSSSLSAVEDFSDADEENDPIVHSFGVFGAGLLPRMANITATSPTPRRRPLRASVSPQQRDRSASAVNYEYSPIRNHVINQLAFSRLHALPLSTILGNLPAAMKEGRRGVVSQDETSMRDAFSEDDLKKLLDETPCVGEIAREGKDAAGKVLEDEFYYVPELDSDTGRRDTVECGLGKPGLRAVRKQHKQYYWKRPRN